MVTRPVCQPSEPSGTESAGALVGSAVVGPGVGTTVGLSVADGVGVALGVSAADGVTLGAVLVAVAEGDGLGAARLLLT